MQSSRHDHKLPGNNSTHSLTLVVPMYNESVRLAETFDQLASYIESWPQSSTLVMVDDGSSDTTCEIAKKLIERRGSRNDIRLVSRPHLGKGAAIRYGLGQSKTDIAAFCDVDLATPLTELTRIIEVARATNGLAIGSRAMPESRLGVRESHKRELAGRSFNLLVRTLACKGVRDTQCGAKAAPTAIWKKLLASSVENGFAWDVEIIAFAQQMSVIVSEIGIEWNHDERSVVNVGKDGIAMAKSVITIARRVRGA